MSTLTGGVTSHIGTQYTWYGIYYELIHFQGKCLDIERFSTVAYRRVLTRDAGESSTPALHELQQAITREDSSTACQLLRGAA